MLQLGKLLFCWLDHLALGSAVHLLLTASCCNVWSASAFALGYILHVGSTHLCHSQYDAGLKFAVFHDTIFLNCPKSSSSWLWSQSLLFVYKQSEGFRQNQSLCFGLYLQEPGISLCCSKYWADETALSIYHYEYPIIKGFCQWTKLVATVAHTPHSSELVAYGIVICATEQAVSIYPCKQDRKERVLSSALLATRSYDTWAIQPGPSADEQLLGWNAQIVSRQKARVACLACHFVFQISPSLIRGLRTAAAASE